MKKIVYCFFILCALTACQKGRTYFPKELMANGEKLEANVEFVRFDKSLLNVHEATVA